LEYLKLLNLSANVFKILFKTSAFVRQVYFWNCLPPETSCGSFLNLQQCRDKKARQARVFAHVFPAKITVLQDSITSERALFSPEEIS
jgi:hypothetical protein